MKEEELNIVYQKIKEEVLRLFESNEELDSFSWTSGAIWNDDWYDNTVSKVVVNEIYFSDSYRDLEDVKQEFAGLYFHLPSELGLHYLSQVVNHYLDENFKKIIFLYDQLGNNYSDSKKELKEVFSEVFNNREYLDYSKVSSSERQYYYDGEGFLNLYESISVLHEEERISLLKYVFMTKILNPFFYMVDENKGTQNLMKTDFIKFMRIASSYCKKHFVSVLMKDKTLKHFRDIAHLLNEIFMTYYKVDSPIQKLDRIQAHEIIPKLTATREFIELKKWREI